MYILCAKTVLGTGDIVVNRCLFVRVCLMCDNVSTLRFVNTLHKEVNISLATDIFLSVGEDYGVSAYTTVQSGE